MSLLIVTSTVNVNSCLTVLVDPEIRLQQYVSSILFYIKVKNIDSIIVCDNSGYDYSKITELSVLSDNHFKKIEFLSFLSNGEKTMKYGKGYGEGEIMSFVVSNSILYRNNEKSFFKVTGRIVVSNIESVIRLVSTQKNYFQRTCFNSLKIENKIDTRFYHIKKYEFEKYLINSYQGVNDNEGFYLEHCFYRSIDENKVKYSFFTVLPAIEGISGSSGVNYTIGKRSFFIRFCVNMLLNFCKK